MEEEPWVEEEESEHSSQKQPLHTTPLAPQRPSSFLDDRNSVFLLIYLFETGSPYVVLARLELTIFK